MGLSLSGLEATSDAAWLLGVLRVFAEHERDGGRLTTRVLYTNGSGLCAETTGATLLPALVAAGLTRVELSRHAVDPARNAAIMRFRPGVAVAEARVFEAMAREVAKAVPLRMVCVLQRGGVETAEQAREYLAWAASLGAGDVVFRELARLGDLYRPGRSVRLVGERRVAVEPFISAFLPGHGVEVVDGYYYYSVRISRSAAIDAIFEASDYAEMRRQHESDVIRKLVFHPHGTLGGDWSPDREILWP